MKPQVMSLPASRTPGHPYCEGYVSGRRLTGVDEGSPVLYRAQEHAGQFSLHERRGERAFVDLRKRKVIAAHLLDQFVHILGVHDRNKRGAPRSICGVCGNLMCQVGEKRHPPSPTLSGMPFQISPPGAAPEPVGLIPAVAMSDETPKARLEKLRLERDAKFDEIV